MQLLDTAGIYARQRVADANARNHAVGRDFRKRQEDESAFEQARMGQRQVGPRQDHVIIGQNVDIDLAWAPAAFVFPVAAERTFHLDRASHQIVRTERSLHSDNRIDGREAGR